MPTTAPTSAPTGHDPAPHPMSAPSPTLPAVVPTSTAPAPAGSKVWRELGSIRGEHTRLCDSGNRMVWPKVAELVASAPADRSPALWFDFVRGRRAKRSG